MTNVFLASFFPREVKQMRLERVSVHGFRNIYNTTLHFNDILALISLNSFGKSNLLSAIDFGTEFIWRAGDTKHKMMRWRRGVPLNRNLASEDFRFELEMTTQREGDTYWVTYGYQFKWIRDSGQGARITGEWLKVKKQERNQKYSQFLLRQDQSAKYKKAETGRCDHPIEISPNELVINKLSAYDDLFFLDIVKAINALRVHVERHLDAKYAYEPEPFIRTDLQELEIDNIRDVPRAIFNLKNQCPDRYKLLINSYQLLFPQIEHLEVGQATLKSKFELNIPEDVPLKVADEIIVLRVIDKNLNQAIDFANMSDGAKRVLLLLTCTILADINGLFLVAIEEPDNCIHPGLFQHLLSILSQITENCRILITSHSPYLVQFLNPENIYIGLPSRDGIARFANIRSTCQKSLIRDAMAVGMTTGEYLFDLISGSDDDIEELAQYLECDNK